MPLIKIDALEGRTQSEVTTLLDAVHSAVVKAFRVPVRDTVIRSIKPILKGP
jgi:Tautomerase enzyme